MQPAPTSTLFPYTTLFRSYARHRRRAGGAECAAAVRGGAEAQTRAGHQQRAHRTRDRKSTRLNSSHSQISYAVCCLQKKIVLGTNPSVEVVEDEGEADA